MPSRPRNPLPPAARAWLRENLLLVLTVAGVVVGCIAGIILAATGALVDHDLKEGEKTPQLKLVGFPGELLLRMLTALVLPLISASIIVGIASLGTTSPWERRAEKRAEKARVRAELAREKRLRGGGESDSDSNSDDRGRISLDDDDDNDDDNDDNGLDLRRSGSEDTNVSDSDGPDPGTIFADDGADEPLPPRQKKTEIDDKLKRAVVGRTVGFFAITTLIAVIIGITMVNIIRPGDNVEHVNATTPNATGAPEPSPKPVDEPPNALDSILDVFRSMFPDNLVRAGAEMDILGVIVFSLVLGSVLVSMGEQGEPLLDAFFSLNEAIMRIVMLVMWYAPFGICSLIMARIGENEDFADLFARIALFAVTVILGLVIHFFGVLSVVYFVVLRRNPFKFYANLLQAIFTGLGTDSSAATMPVTLRCVTEKCGVSPTIAQIVLPLGVTLNMNGTALYEAVAAIFVAQINGIDLTIGQTIIIAITSTLAAAGAAGIPEAGLITMALVFSAVGLPLDDIALLLTIDWLLDRLRTVVNILSDAVCSAVVDELHKRAMAKLAPFETIEEVDTRHEIAVSDG
jgi:Na+/H+-dicarboxylate symporter